MEKENLELLIEEGLTQQEIADRMGCSQTSIRHYLDKFGLKTKRAIARGNGTCITCGNVLKGRQEKYCSKKCKNKELYTYNPNNYLKQKERAKERKIEFVKKLGGKCCKCGYKKNLAALHFHHRISSEKKFQIDFRMCANTKKEILIEEINKCDLLCANCRAEEHYKDLNDLLGD